MKTETDNNGRWIALASELDNMVRDWDRQMDELNSARAGLENCDRDSAQECEEDNRVQEKFAKRLEQVIDKHTGRKELLEACKAALERLLASYPPPGGRTDTVCKQCTKAIKKAEGL